MEVVVVNKPMTIEMVGGPNRAVVFSDKETDTHVACAGLDEKAIQTYGAALYSKGQLRISFSESGLGQEREVSCCGSEDNQREAPDNSEDGFFQELFKIAYDVGVSCFLGHNNTEAPHREIRLAALVSFKFTNDAREMRLDYKCCDWPTNTQHGVWTPYDEDKLRYWLDELIRRT